MDEVRVYGRALTLGEIQTAMNTPIGGAQPDTTAPMRSNGQPSGTLPAGTQSAQISLATDENASCRYALAAGTPYGGDVRHVRDNGRHEPFDAGVGVGQRDELHLLRAVPGHVGQREHHRLHRHVQHRPSSTPPPSDGIAAYGLDEGSGPTATDASGNSNHGTIVGATWTTQGRYGGALSFDGINDRVSGPTITLSGAFTLMAWIYNPSNAALETIVTVGSNARSLSE